MDKEQFDIANTAFQEATVADDALIDIYKSLLEHHLTTNIGNSMRELLEKNLKEAQETPQITKDKLTPTLIKFEEEEPVGDIDGN